MNKIVIFLSLFTLILSACSTNELSTNVDMEIENIPEMQENETTDHMSVIGTTNQFLSIVGSSEDILITSEDVEYRKSTTGYLARPDDNKQYPGIILIHEWWGLNEHIKEVANTLAKEGYVVLAVDLYDGEVAQSSEEAMKLRTSINQSIATQNMQDGIEYLRELEGVNKVASLGFCFGGEQSAQLSISDANLDATVIFYGSLPQELEEISQVDAPVFGIFGELDTGITPDTVRTFQSGLEELNLENDITIYEGVGHAFLNPEGSRFAEEETKDAWNKTITFLANNLN